MLSNSLLPCSNVPSVSLSQVAFVDSGAQMTVMSYKCAEKLGILHLVDERFAGVAVGVGESKILGKVRDRIVLATPNERCERLPLCFFFLTVVVSIRRLS